MPKECLRDFDDRQCVQSIINDPGCKEVPFPSRTITRNSTIPSLFNRTLATLDTLRACQSYLRVRDVKEGETADTKDGKKKEALLVASLGHGLDGHPGLAHGSTIATLFDEGLSLGALQVLDKKFMTAESTIKYEGAVPTPSVNLVRCYCKKKA